MKIGILTQPIHWNYGGILQNWALQQVLRGMGHEPIKLEYYIPWHELPLFTKLKRDIKTVALRAIGRGREREVLIIRKKRLSLRGLDITCTGTFRDANKLPKYASKVDAFIVGSDQVWRQEYSPGIEDFFLTFLPDSDHRLRVSYAASFGKSAGYIDADKMDACRAGLSKFTAVSVREREGLEILARDFGRDDASLVLDPTLLLKTADYERIMAKKSPMAKPYISAYFLDETPAKRAILESLQQKLGITNLDLMGTKYNHFEGARIPTIGQWIRSIAGSEVVITDSFHGMVFSLIFHKPFVVLANKTRGLDRYRTLLEPLGLTDRLISDDTIAAGIDLDATIDWQRVDNHLDTLRHQSIDFLKKALKQE